MARDDTRPWELLSLPQAVTRIPAMLADEEKQYLTWLAAERFEGWGAIVDLGPWLGGSSALLAEGLKRQGKRHTVFSLDLFKWEPLYMEAVSHEGLNQGDDFLPLFVREVGEYSAWIQAERSDLMTASWDRGPIEILFVDAAKTWELTNAVLRTFGPHLEPGRSRVVLQDFRHYSCHWLPLIFDSRPDIWKEVESVESGWTVTFTPLKPLHAAPAIHADYDEVSFPLASADALLRSRIARESRANQQLLLRSLYRKYLIEDGPADDTATLREQVLGDGITAGELALIENLEGALLPRGWRAYCDGDYRTARHCAERCIVVSGERLPHALALLTIARLKLGDLDAAREHIEEIAACHPDPVLHWLYRAELALAEGRHEEAGSAVRRALDGGCKEQSQIEWATSLLNEASAGARMAR